MVVKSCALQIRALVFFGVLSLLAAGCTSVPESKKARPLEYPAPVDPAAHADIEPVPVEIHPETPPQLPPPVAEAAPPSDEEAPPVVAVHKPFAVWIDGVGFESLAALGFLQELERVEMRPAKIVGVGFGCWVAASWAQEGSGNQAEWQAFKWTQWELLKRGVLQRLSVKSGERRFQDEVDRLFSLKNPTETKIPMDCPLMDSEAGYTAVSSTDLPLWKLLWFQFQIPALGVDLDAAPQRYVSGAVLSPPSARDLDVVSRGLDTSPDNFSGWLVLKTRKASDRGGASKWSRYLAERAEQEARQTTPTFSAQRYITIDLSDPGERSLTEISKEGQRRRWLLQGRAKAQEILARSESFKAFLNRP